MKKASMGKEQPERVPDYSYSTAHLANEINITSEGLRYYESKGIGKALKKENGYRSYHPQETVVLRLIRNLNAFGFSLKEAIDLVTEEPFSLEKYQSALSEKRRLLEIELEDRQRVLSCLSGIENSLTYFRKETPVKIWFEDRPAFYYLEYFTGLYAYHHKDLNELMKKWMGRMPIVYPMPVLTVEEFAKSADPFVSGGLAINEEAVTDPSFLDDTYCRFYPKRNYLCTVSCQRNQQGVSIKEPGLQESFRMMEQMNLKIDGDIFFQSVGANETDSEIILYYKVYIPTASIS